MNFTNEESLPDMNYADSFYQKRVLSGSDYETESQESETDSEIHRAVGIEDTAKNRSAPKAEVSQNVPGSKCEVKFLYNHSSISRGPGSIWSENADLILEEDRLKALAAPYAIVHRFSKSKGRKKNGALAWETHSIEIQSNKLKAFLDTIFEDYRDWDPDTEPYTFRPPFREVFHRWEALKLKYAQQPDESVRDEVKMLIDIFLPFMTPHRTALEEIERTETISFSQLWLIFPPGELVVALIEGNMCVCRLRKLAIGQKDLTLTMEQFDWNGRYCGFKDTLVELFAYPELKPMSKLRPYPLRFASNKEIQTKLLARGRQFAALRGFHVRKCVGEKYVSLRKSHDQIPRVDNNPRPVSSSFSLHWCLAKLGLSEVCTGLWESYRRRICVLSASRDSFPRLGPKCRKEALGPKQYRAELRATELPRSCKRGEKRRVTTIDRLGMHPGGTSRERL
jgi:hypothetical protein